MINKHKTKVLVKYIVRIIIDVLFYCTLSICMRAGASSVKSVKFIRDTFAIRMRLYAKWKYLRLANIYR